MRVWKVILTLAVLILVALLPAVDTYAATSSETRKKVDDLRMKRGKEQTSLSKVNAKIAEIQKEIDAHNATIEQLDKQQQEIERKLIQARNIEIAAMQKVEAATSSLYQEGYLESPLGNLLKSQGIQEFVNQFDLLKSVMNYLYEDYYEYKKAADQVNKKVEEVKALQEQQTNEMKKVQESTVKLIEEQKRIQGNVKKYDDELEDYGDELIKINRELLESGRLKFDYTGPLGMPCKACSLGTIRSGFGTRIDPVYGGLGNHKGLDFRAPLGNPVTAVADGVVVVSRSSRGYGWLMVIYHGHKNGQPVYSAYAHSYPKQVKVTLGEDVRKGQVISAVGSNGKSTGPHMHFEIRYGDVNNQTNPKPWLFP